MAGTLLLQNSPICQRPGTTINLAGKLMARYAAGTLQCPDTGRVCRSLACGSCDPAGGFCSFNDGRCHCWLERTGPGCSASLVPGQG